MVKALLVCFITLFFAFPLFAQPVITSFSPVAGRVGTSVTISGSNFSATASDNTVLFGTVKATVTAASATSLTVTVPAGATGQLLSVTVNYLTATATQPFTVTHIHGGTLDANAFTAGLVTTLGSGPACMATGDLNGDGKPEEVVSNSFNNTISIVRNQGSPGSISMGAQTTYSTGAQPLGIAIGDVNGDGKPDLVVTNSLSNSVSVFRNTGTGATISFDPKIDLPAAYTPQNVVIRDMDGDGKPDLVVGNYSTYIEILRNTGSGGAISFAPKVAYEMVAETQDLCVEDLDGDGKPDIVATNTAGSPTGPCGITVLRNTTSTPGTISFAPKLTVVTGTTHAEAIACSDLDNDGKPDISLLHTAHHTLTVLRNMSSSGSIAFDTQVDFTTGNSPSELAIDDLDGDGWRDIAVVYEGNPQDLSVFKNTSNTGVISLATGINYTFYYASLIAIADMDIDGKPDLVTGQTTSNQGGITRNRIMEPVVTDFTPTEGLNGTLITITGENFTGTTQVTFGGTAATSFTVVSPVTITATVGTGAGGRVTVTNQSGPGYKDGFNFIYPSSISSFTPGYGSSGNTITITGIRFTNASAVSFGGVPAQSFTVVNDNTITAVVGAGTSGPVSVTAPSGTGSRAGFTFIPRSPSIVSFSPTAASAGQTVTISGSGFYGVTSVSFGGTPANSFTVVSPTTITAVLGSGSSGWIIVSTQYNGSGSIGGFQYTTLPVVSSFAPASAGTGETITIRGGNFTGATLVSLGGTPVTSFTVVSPGVITAVVGSGATGDVSVTTADGTANLGGFVFNTPLSIPSPEIHSFAPAAATTGETVTITGAHFTGASAVRLGGKPAASFVVESATTIRAVVANGASGAVSVTTPQGMATKSGFVYIAAHAGLIVYPNPASGWVWVQHPVSENAMTLKVMDLHGRVIKMVVIPAGMNKTRIDLHGLLAGCYRVMLQGNDYVWSENVIVQ